ncbi:MAG: hypothetical protein KA792_01655 [Bacteroidales bacterium]|nr:hypothetical protein [Bacteroidales bacterium]
MDSFAEELKKIKYFIEEVEEFKIFIFYIDYDEKNLNSDLLNEDLHLPDDKFYISENLNQFANHSKSINLFFERNAFYTINAGGSSHIYGHNFVLPEKVLNFLRNKFKSIRNTNKKKLQPASNNKAFCIEIEIKNIKNT